MVRILLYLVAFFALNISTAQPTLEQVPNQSGYNIALSFDFTEDGQYLAVSTKFGEVYITNLQTGQRFTEPVIDIKDEVYPSGEQGMLDINIKDGWIYANYCVKRTALGLNPIGFNGQESASIIRVRKWQIDFENNTVLDDVTLLGSELNNGIPILGSNHVGGTLEFLSDGTLLITTGTVQSAPYTLQAIEDGIVSTPIANGYYKAQQTSFLGGKVLRIDPNTGLAPLDNPFYPSLVWARGFRNPFRAVLHNDILYVGDVGQSRYESIKAIKQGVNGGFPFYEGIEPYQAPNALNPDLNTSFANLITEATSYEDNGEWQVQKATFAYGRFNNVYSKVNNYLYVQTESSAVASGISVIVGVVSEQFNDKLLFSDYFLNTIYAATLENSYISDVESLGNIPLNSIVKYREHPITKEVWILNPSNGLYKLLPNTLNIKDFTQDCVNCYKRYYNLLGQLVDIDTAPVGVYIEQTLKEGIVVKSNKIIKRGF